MDDRQLEKLERLLLILWFGGSILSIGSVILAGKLDLVDPNIVAQSPPFIVAMSVICILMFLWWLIGGWLLLKNSTIANILYLRLLMFLAKVERKIKRNGR